MVWFHPALEQFPCEIGIKDHGDTRGVKVYFKTPITGLQHVFMPTETFSESYDLESGNTLGYSMKYVQKKKKCQSPRLRIYSIRRLSRDPLELYTKVADRYKKEEKQLKAKKSTTGIPQIGKLMEKLAVSTNE